MSHEFIPIGLGDFPGLWGRGLFQICLEEEELVSQFLGMKKGMSFLEA